MVTPLSEERQVYQRLGVKYNCRYGDGELERLVNGSGCRSAQKLINHAEV